MSTFTIDTDNNITVYSGTEEVAQAGGSTTTSFDSLAARSKCTQVRPPALNVRLFVRHYTRYNSFKGPPLARKRAAGLDDLSQTVMALVV